MATWPPGSSFRSLRDTLPFFTVLTKCKCRYRFRYNLGFSNMKELATHHWTRRQFRVMSLVEKLWPSEVFLDSFCYRKEDKSFWCKVILAWRNLHLLSLSFKVEPTICRYYHFYVHEWNRFFFLFFIFFFTTSTQTTIT